MRYAIVDNGIVTNLIWLYEGNAGDFPNAVPCDDYPVTIGDTYKDDVFYHNGERLLTPIEYTQKYYEETIAELDAALLDITYENIMGGLE